MDFPIKQTDQEVTIQSESLMSFVKNFYFDTKLLKRFSYIYIMIFEIYLNNNLKKIGKK